MSRRQSPERNHQIPNRRIVCREANSLAELLHQVDTGAPIWRIYHQMHCAFRFKHTSQGAQSCIWVCKMMEDAGAHNLVKAGFQLTHLFDGQLMNLEIV